MRRYLLGLVLLSACWLFAASMAAAAKLSGKPSDPYLESIYWYDGQTRKFAWKVSDELAVFPVKGKSAQIDKGRLLQLFDPNCGVSRENDFVIFLRSPQPLAGALLRAKASAIKALANIRGTSPVFYTAEQKGRMTLTGEIIIKFKGQYGEFEIRNIEQKYGLSRLKAYRFDGNAYLYQVEDVVASLDTANQLFESGQVVYAYPNWLRERAPRALPDDTLFPDQWHLVNTGQGGGTPGEDVNIIGVWDLFLGSPAEVIAIVDNGLEIAHEDLSANVLPGESWDYVDGDTDPTAGGHGTSCAGVAAAQGFNGKGVTGAAPMAGLVGYRLLGAETDANEADALTKNFNVIDIYSNSWGPYDDGMRLDGPGALTEKAMQNGALHGRGGLGSIFVWAGGNGYDSDNSNYDGYANSRYTIAVGASTNFGKRAAYSEKGANLIVNAPSSGGSMAITTTDRSGNLGYSTGDYTNTFSGTSAATPLVSGIVALMLEANPNLSWRDVQQVLMETAEKNDPGDSDWQTNGSGYHVNHKYGFGRIDAEAAVNAATLWKNVAPELTREVSSNPHLSIPDNDSTGVTDTIFIPDDIRIEFVEIYFSAPNHPYWGDLEVILKSPAGTESVLAEKHNSGGTARYDNWRFGSARHFGESSPGYWTLTVKDLWQSDMGTFESWRLKIYGTRNGYVSKSLGPDFDRNLIADYTLWRPSTGYWYGKDPELSTRFSKNWGIQRDIPFADDFDGDGRTDFGVWRPADGTWYILLSSYDYSPADAIRKRWGNNGDVAVPGDYDGDGRADLGIWRPADGTWYVIDTQGKQIAREKWGNYGDIAVPGDYNGDGTTDLGIWRPVEGKWYVKDIEGNVLLRLQWGANGDVPVPADFNGDHITDLGLWRPSNQGWYLKEASGHEIARLYFGQSGDIPVAADYDGDQQDDLCIWRASEGGWKIQTAASGFSSNISEKWGLFGDLPVGHSPFSGIQSYLKQIGYY